MSGTSKHSTMLFIVQALGCVWLFVTPWTAARQASLSITNSQSLLKLMSIKLVMPSNHLFFCHPLLLLPSVFASIRVLSNESVLPIRWPKYWSFSFSISPSNEYSGLISINIIYYLKPFPVPATLAFPPSFKQAANQNPSSLEPRANAATVWSPVFTTSFHCSLTTLSLPTHSYFLRDGESSVFSFLSSVQFSCSVVFDSLQPHGLQHARIPCPSPTPRAYSNSCPSSRWSHPTISSSVIPFSSCLQSFPESGSYPMSKFFASGGQSIAVSALASVLPMNIQDWFPLGWTGWIFLKSKWLSRVFSNTTVQKHQFFGTQLSLQSKSHIHTWLLEKPQFWLDRPLLAK